MPIQIIESKDGYYIPMDGPWGSVEDDLAFRAAERKYDELKGYSMYVALIKSHHDYSHGYWVEVKKKEVKYPDFILKEHIVNETNNSNLQ